VGVGEVPSLKEVLQEANDDLDREAELMEQASEVPIEHQVFEKEYEDGCILLVVKGLANEWVVLVVDRLMLSWLRTASDTCLMPIPRRT
jgi:hypothetical protein